MFKIPWWFWLGLAILTCLLLWQFGVKSLLAAFGIGGAAALANRSKGAADEHEKLADGYKEEANQDIAEANEHRNDALDLADDITPVNEPTPGTTRKRFTSS